MKKEKIKKQYMLIGETLQLFESNCSYIKTLILVLLDRYQKFNSKVSPILIERLTEDHLMIVLEDILNITFPPNKKIDLNNTPINKTITLDSEFYEIINELKKSFFKLKDIRNRITHTDFTIDSYSKDEILGLSGIKTSSKKKLNWQKVQYTFKDLEIINLNAKKLRDKFCILIYYFVTFDDKMKLKLVNIPKFN